MTSTTANNDSLDRLALWLSRVIHPFILVVPVLAVATWLAGEPFIRSVAWGLLSIPVAITPLALYIALGVRRGTLSDWDVSQQEQRRAVYFIGLAGVALLFVVYYSFNAPLILRASLIAALVAFAVGAFVNQAWTKISIHAMAAAGSTAVLAYALPVAGVVATFAMLAVGWSRVRLGRHTAAQVAGGWIVAVLSVVGVFRFLL